MSLLDFLAPQVTHTAKKRGQELYEDGHVQIFRTEPESIEALVTSVWVALDRGDDTINFLCGCPHYKERFTPCGHVWAALLGAYENGMLSSWDSGEPVHLVADDEVFGFVGGSIDWTLEPDSLSAPADLSNDPSTVAESVSNSTPPKLQRPRSTRPPPVPAWKRHFQRVREGFEVHRLKQPEPWPPGREILYVLEKDEKEHLTIELAFREKKADGSWGKIHPLYLSAFQVATLPDPCDQRILAPLLGGAPSYEYYYHPSSGRYRLTPNLVFDLLPHLCESDRCHWRVAQGAPLRHLRWDGTKPWEVWVEVSPNAKGTHYVVRGVLRRGEERMDLYAPEEIWSEGLLIREKTIAPFDDLGAFPWMSFLRRQKALTVPREEKDAWLAELLRLPNLPRLELPEELRFEQVTVTPRPLVKVRAEPTRSGSSRLLGELSFSYDGNLVAERALGGGVPDPSGRRLILRDRTVEWEAAERLREVGFRLTNADSDSQSEWEVSASRLPGVVRTLVGEGWEVEAEGKLFRRPGRFRFEITSGVDWFELHGGCAFEDEEVPLPRVLEALRRGETWVRLGDGTFGMLAEEWLRRYGLVAGLGTVEGDHMHFERNQAFLLDALLASQPEVSCDGVFDQARREIASFEGIVPVSPSEGFVGDLRSYQREGLGWLGFLRQMGFGGCLADDMGLGKTVQALALLEGRRSEYGTANGEQTGHRPSLVVVPRSLVYNWAREAARFTPKLRVLDYSTSDRTKSVEELAHYDLILTTYGTLRRDILYLKDVEFDYAILDEAQAIKNPDTNSAKAARLLRARHRLALTGTPVENHLGELWSLFEFLNPGMLGSAKWSPLMQMDWRAPDVEAHRPLARALRPFILRRTKEQVEKDLPPKQEETLHCVLGPAERNLYEELRDYYRKSLLTKIDREGMSKSKLLILEGLLRLRQVACHPGLVDQSRRGEPSAKLELLIPLLEEVFEEGQKALVFSQFVSLLSILRSRLDEMKLTYEYLDGRTRHRDRPVERFQNDPECKLFLISLKAGGFGLNLTAAEYVFILDPWWNPAVETQAIDRAHRIGQSRPVFAYRIIASETVEEKVLELQQSKRQLADSILRAERGVVKSLKKEDLELLLS